MISLTWRRHWLLREDGLWWQRRRTLSSSGNWTGIGASKLARSAVDIGLKIELLLYEQNINYSSVLSLNPLSLLRLCRSNSTNFRTIYGRFRNRVEIGMPYRPGRLHRRTGRYDNSVPTQFLAPVDCFKIPAQKEVIYESVKTSFWQKSYEILHDWSLEGDLLTGFKTGFNCPWHKGVPARICTLYSTVA